MATDLSSVLLLFEEVSLDAADVNTISSTYYGKILPADFGIWSMVEITNFNWHKNYSYPVGLEFQQLRKTFERSV